MIFNNSSQASKGEQDLVLSPMFRLPILIILAGLTNYLLPTPSWITITIVAFGLFLLLQSFTLRLKITNKELVVLQLGRELRRFPFEKWISWKIIFPRLPGFLYFREEASPHLLPLLFNPQQLDEMLNKRVGKLKIGEAKN